MNGTNHTHGADLNSYFFALFIIEGIIAVPTVLGNSLLIFTIRRNRTLHTRSYVLIANLAVSDLLFGLLFIPYDMAAAVFPSLREHKTTCLLRNVLLLEFVGASVFNLLIMSLERYAAVAYPLWHLKLSSRYLIVSIIAAWTFSSIIAILPLLGWNYWNTTLKCKYRWNHTFTDGYASLWIFTFVITIMVSVVLFIRVVIISFRMLKPETGAEGQHIRKMSRRSLTSSIEKTKVLILILGSFIVCWIPYCIVVILLIFIPRNNEHLNEAYLYSGTLAMLNSAINWIIYGVKNRNIRRGFKSLLCNRKEEFTQTQSDNVSFR